MDLVFVVLRRAGYAQPWNQRVDGDPHDPVADETSVAPIASGTETSAARRYGPFQVVARLGAGGMGEVFRALDTRLNRTVAIKVLPPHIADDPRARERFEWEARAVAALNHPHICTLYDIGNAAGRTF